MTTRRTIHLTDDRLVQVCVDGRTTSRESDHLASCDPCRERRGRLHALLHEVTSAADADTSDVFTPERLALQRERIRQRIAQDGRPARVIAFPATTAVEARPFRTRPAARWLAAAAAVGLAVGLLLSRLTQQIPAARALRASTPHGVSARLEPATFAPQAIALSEDELLGQIENAVDGPVPALRPLHELTPLADQVLISEP